MSIRSSTKPSSLVDDAHMARALELARRGVSLTHPNPAVGAVIVKSGRVVGEGFHVFDRRDHAEVVALNAAGGLARGSTLYITLEPCCHSGRTGPCTRAIIDAGVKRVVVAMKDPNPLVSGKGMARLRRAGVQLVTGIRAAEAWRLNEDFSWWITHRRPFVTLKTALTLDGQIAEKSGSVTWITSQESRDQVQRLRHAADALITGVGTILADDPRMTDRTELPRRRPLLRAIVDTHLRTPPDSEIVRSAKDDLVVFTAEPLDSPKAKALVRCGIEVVRVRPRNLRVDLGEVLDELGRREILNAILEAGATLNGAALAAGLVNKMILFYAPKIMGPAGIPMANVASGWFKQSRALEDVQLSRFGPDFCVEGYFHNVYRNHRTRRND